VTSVLTVGSLFSGIGGFDLGLERTGMRVRWQVEIDPYCQRVLAKHWPHVQRYGDIQSVDWGTVEPVDVLCGGFPCQDISLAGKGAGLAGERSGLWFEYAKAIEALTPRYVIIENVAALRSRGLDQVLGALAALGYDAEWHCIPASAVGAPHQRDRVWIVAYPQLHGRVATTLAGSIEETIRHQSQRPDNTFDVTGASSVPAPSANVADTDIVGTQVQAEGQHASQQVLRGTSEAWRTTVGGFWSVEPNVGRVADGVSGRVDRLKQLGNAVVPQIPELIGRAINAIA